MVEVEPAVQQPGDQVDALLARLALEAVEQTQRFEIDSAAMCVNVLFLTCRAGPEQLHFALDSLDVPRTGERPA